MFILMLDISSNNFYNFNFTSKIYIFIIIL